jgi:hypothetical protein
LANYNAAPIQPIINGLISIGGGGPVFVGRGISSIMRTPGGAGAGDFLMILDQGAPGSVGLDPNYARTMITQRGTLGATITQQAVTYPSTATIRIVTSAASAGTDPTVLEIAVWRTN